MKSQGARENGIAMGPRVTYAPSPLRVLDGIALRPANCVIGAVKAPIDGETVHGEALGVVNHHRVQRPTRCVANGSARLTGLQRKIVQAVNAHILVACPSNSYCVRSQMGMCRDLGNGSADGPALVAIHI